MAFITFEKMRISFAKKWEISGETYKKRNTRPEIMSDKCFLSDEYFLSNDIDVQLLLTDRKNNISPYLEFF